ncbi:MAG: PAS domain-containing protein, partial [Rhodospirillales bacterium]
DELRQSKSDLQVSNRFLDRLLDTAPLPVLLVTARRGRVVMANAAAEAMVGVASGGLVGRPSLPLCRPANCAGRQMRRRVVQM